MNRLSLALAASLAAISAASAQSYRDSANTTVQGVVPLIGCVSGGNCAGPVSNTNPMPVSGTFSATLSGFAPASVGTPIAVTTGGVTGTLPAGTVVVATNVGTTNGAYCALGASSTTAQQYIAPNGGWFAFTVGASTQLTCITSTSTTTVNMVGGSGLATGTGGGGGGGSGGTVTQGAANTAANGWPVKVTDGTNVAAVKAASTAALAADPAAVVTFSPNTGLPTGANTIGAISNTTFAATQSGTWNITNISGTVSLPTGAATSANQSTEITSLGTIATNSGTQATAANQTTLITDLTRAQGVIGAATAPTYMNLGGVVYNSTPITLTNGQSGALQGDANGYLEVNIKAGAGSGGTALADQGTFTQSTTNETPMGCLYVSSYTAATSGKSTVVQCDSGGAPYVNVKNTLTALALNSSAVTGSTTGSPTFSQIAAYNGSTVDGLLDDANKNLKVAQQATSTGGATATGNIAANNTTAVVVKASAGTLYGVQVYGIGSAPAYLKIYNAASATCGSGTPIKRLMIPAASTAANGAGSNITFGPQGVAFGTGITYCVTTGITDADTTAPAASTFLVNLDWN